MCVYNKNKHVALIMLRSFIVQLRISMKGLSFVNSIMSDLRCVHQLTRHANTRLCTHGSVVRKWFVKVSRPASVYLHTVRDKPKSNMCIKTQVAVADVAPTSAPRHAARVRTWLKGATEWVGGWGVCMSVWVGVATV